MSKKDIKKNEEDPYIPLSERQAVSYEVSLQRYLEENGGHFLRDEDGSLHIILNGRRILLNYDRTNGGTAWLMLQACGISNLSAGAQAAIQRLRVYADDKADKIHFKRFSTFSESNKRIYVPIYGGKLLLITPNQIEVAQNGVNEDSFWVEHPCDLPFKYSGTDNIKGLKRFENLLVETQSCQVLEMRWFVAVFAGLMPYIRDVYTARFILELIGPSQNGKTTGARRFTRLHGVGDVKGNYSDAALGNSPDEGFIVLDNKEQGNFTRELIDYCLFLATGAERGRSRQDGTIRKHNKSRPVAIITTIEGVPKEELKNRCVRVEYIVSGEKFDNDEIIREIEAHRDEILSSIVVVLQTYLQIREENKPTPNPIPEFKGFFKAVCDLLRAYSQVAGKPEGWAESIITVWNSNISGREEDGNDLEQKIHSVLYEQENTVYATQIEHKTLEYEGKKGTLYVFQCADLLSLLQKLYHFDQMLPKDASAFSRRLRSSKFQQFTLLDEKSGLEALKRKGTRRVLGLFRTEKEEESQ